MNILIFRGKPKKNGITTALLNLLKNIDLSEHNVTLLLVKSRKYSADYIREALDERIEIIEKDTSLYHAAMEQTVRKTGIPAEKTGLFKKLIRQDIKELFGNRSFDVCIDFDGYNLYYAHMLTAIKAKHLIWLHNDMYGEYTRRSPWLIRTFQFYDRFDLVVSCGKGVNKVNRENLSEKYGIAPEKFVYVDNLFDGDTVRSEAEKAPAVTLPEDTVSFVTVGRCSVEKNHKALIRAFSEFHEEYPETRLVIIGSGPDLEEERELAEKLSPDGSIIMTGALKNPYAVMKQCTCFILPSLHEGFPMVVGEARALGLPLILGRFSTVEGCLIDKGQFVTDSSEEGIVCALLAFMDGRVPLDYDYDEKEHNKTALRQFYEVIS
ncbi:MAG: glycosyltransferase [Lachnospiraceae bacterium]|nr:glycosyltransferase [Lachnospiraceae bacterium]